MEVPNSFITKEMGDQFAHDINAVKYLECSSTDGKLGKTIFEEAVRVLGSSTSDKETISIVVLGNNDSEKSFIINNFLQEKHTGLPLDSYTKSSHSIFETYATIGGKELTLEIHDILASQVPYQLRNLIDVDFIVVVLSTTAEPDSCIAAVEELIQAQKKTSLPPIILALNQTGLNNRTKTSRHASQHKKSLVTSEMGKQLASKINAAKYMECSNFDETGLEKVFKEAIGISLRKAEEKKRNFHLKKKSEPGFLERFSNWLF